MGKLNNPFKSSEEHVKCMVTKLKKGIDKLLPILLQIMSTVVVFATKTVISKGDMESVVWICGSQKFAVVLITAKDDNFSLSHVRS